MLLPQLRRIRWAVRATLLLGVAASVLANILHALDNPISQAIAAWPPVALLLTVELISRVPVHRRLLAATRLFATATIAGIAAWVSYWHMAGVASRYGETGASPYLLPLSVDGLIVVASICLVELGGRIAALEHPAAIPAAAAATPAAATPAAATPATPAAATPATPAAATPAGLAAATLPAPPVASAVIAAAPLVATPAAASAADPLAAAAAHPAGAPMAWPVVAQTAAGPTAQPVTAAHAATAPLASAAAPAAGGPTMQPDAATAVQAPTGSAAHALADGVRPATAFASHLGREAHIMVDAFPGEPVRAEAPDGGRAAAPDPGLIRAAAARTGANPVVGPSAGSAPSGAPRAGSAASRPGAAPEMPSPLRRSAAAAFAEAAAALPRSTTGFNPAVSRSGGLGHSPIGAPANGRGTANGGPATRPAPTQRGKSAGPSAKGTRSRRSPAETVALAERIKAERPTITETELAAELGISPSRWRTVRREAAGSELAA